eukprot:NP_500472.1 Seven TM Receptor [Caenorhabditis elegans]
MHAALRFGEYFGCIFTEISNLVLLYLIITKTPKSFGSYKYLMMSYALDSLIYGLVEVLTLPERVIHASGASVYLFVDSFLRYEKWIANPLAALYACSFALCITLLASHFVFRYIAVCRPHDLHHLEGWKMWKIYVIPIIITILWYLVHGYFCGPTEFKTELVRQEIWDNYQVDFGSVGYFGFLYFYTDNTGVSRANWIDFLGTATNCTVMTICTMVMTISGLKTYKKINDNKRTISKRTKELNKQLFRTLVIQTIIPIFTLFFPVGAIIVLPIFSIPIPTSVSNVVTMTNGIYPGLDALVVIFMIQVYRDAVFCKTRKLVGSLSVMTPVKNNSLNNNTMS